MAIDPTVLTPKSGAGDPVVSGNFRGALMFKALSGGMPVDQVYPSAESPYPPLTFDEAEYDTDGFWDYGRNCFVIPYGISMIRLTGQIIFETNSVGDRQLVVQKSEPGSAAFNFFRGTSIHNTPAVNGTTTDIAIVSAWFPVVAGEGYALLPYQNSGSSLVVSGGPGTWFSLDAI